MKKGWKFYVIFAVIIIVTTTSHVKKAGVKFCDNQVVVLDWSRLQCRVYTCFLMREFFAHATSQPSNNLVSKCMRDVWSKQFADMMMKIFMRRDELQGLVGCWSYFVGHVL